MECQFWSGDVFGCRADSTKSGSIRVRNGYYARHRRGSSCYTRNDEGLPRAPKCFCQGTDFDQPTRAWDDISHHDRSPASLGSALANLRSPRKKNKKSLLGTIKLLSLDVVCVCESSAACLIRAVSRTQRKVALSKPSLAAAEAFRFSSSGYFSVCRANSRGSTYTCSPSVLDVLFLSHHAITSLPKREINTFKHVLLDFHSGYAVLIDRRPCQCSCRGKKGSRPFGLQANASAAALHESQAGGYRTGRHPCETFSTLRKPRSQASRG